MKSQKMYKIYIDTTQRFLHVIRLIKDGAVVDEVTGDLDVTSEIAQLLKKHKLKPEDISDYESNPGPGSFMGIKMGITVVNVLNFILGKRSLDKLEQPEYGREPNITIS